MSHQLVHSDDIPRARQDSWMQATKPILKIRSVSSSVSESVRWPRVWCVGVVCGVVCRCGVQVWCVVWCVGVGQTVVSYPHTFHLASFPGPAQLFSDCGTEIQGKPGIFFSREHDKIRKWQNLQNIVCFQLTTWCVRQSPPAGQIHVVSYLVPWLFFLVLGPVHPHTIKIFYHLFILTSLM